MIPIFEQGKGKGKGIGHSINSFLKRFTDICQKAKAENRRKTFAFILYNFEDSAIEKLLKDEGVFTKLDRLTGNSLDVFYLHSNDDASIKGFNEIILHSFNFKEYVEVPCVIFFDVFDLEVEDANVVEIEQDNILLGFNEIAIILQKQINSENDFYNNKSIKSKGLKILYKISDKVATGLVVSKIKDLLSNLNT